MAGLTNLLQATALGKLLGLNNSQPPVKVNVTNRQGDRMGIDHRVRIKVPIQKYFASSYTNGNEGDEELLKLEGIIFPYTPTISLEHKADYSSVNAMHTNYAQHFYQRSSVGSITITGKFTVQNDSDAIVYLSTLHLLRALTKMLVNGEENAGSPPPVCRLFAYGPYMLENVPVAINNFKNDLPENVDYYALPTSNTFFKGTMVPVVSSISVTLLPMYSRREQQNFTVKEWIAGNLNSKGYL
jgi:hypothetical protein